MIDCHVHVFDPARFPYAPVSGTRPRAVRPARPHNRCLLDAMAQGVVGVAMNVALLGVDFYRDIGPLLALFEQLVPNVADRSTILWDTPQRRFGFA